MKGYLRNKGRENKVRHIRLPYYLIESQAYQSLSFKARAVYTEIKRRYNGGNNGEINCAISSICKALSCAPGTASRALEELEEKGFVKCRFKGRFSHKVSKGSEYILTEYEYNNQRATKDFMKWTPE